MSKITDHQLRQLISGMAGVDLTDRSEFFDVMYAFFEAHKLPCAPENIFLVEDRLPVYSDILGRRSVLKKILADRNGETALVADTLLPGKDGLFLTSLLPFREKVNRWLDAMNPNYINIHLKQFDDTILVAAPLRSFVQRHEE